MKSFVKVVTIAAAVMPTLSSALPYEDGVVTVGNRQFLIGEVTRAFSDNWRQMPLGHSEVLREFLAGEPLFSSWKAEFLETGIPADELVGDLFRHISDSSKIQKEPELQVNGYDVFSLGQVDLSIFPQESKLNYSASCSRGHQTDELLFCRVKVVYPYDTHVALSADAFFRGHCQKSVRISKRLRSA